MPLEVDGVGWLKGRYHLGNGFFYRVQRLLQDGSPVSHPVLASGSPRVKSVESLHAQRKALSYISRCAHLQTYHRLECSRCSYSRIYASA
ncbi:hypothetical protein J6590_003280 [Homalodisca vitripennis]|nr:hypothetical protein J6590_003280 [Homalodisca vitripennis]